MKVQSVDIFHCSIIGACRDWSSTALSFNRPLLILSFNSPLSLSPAHLYAALSCLFGLALRSTKPLIVRFNILQLKSTLIAQRNE